MHLLQISNLNEIEDLTSSTSNYDASNRELITFSYILALIFVIILEEVEPAANEVVPACLPTPNPAFYEFPQMFRKDIVLLVETCYKYSKGKSNGSKTCRMRVPRMLVKTSNIDPSADQITMRRSHPWVNNFNEWIISAGRSNMDIKFIWTGDDVQALVYYITDYVTKNQVWLSTIIGTPNLQASLQQKSRKEAPILVFRNALRTQINNTAVLNKAMEMEVRSIVCLTQDYVKETRIEDSQLRKAILELPDNKTEHLPGYLPLVPGMPILLTENITTEFELSNGTRSIFRQLVYNELSDGIQFGNTVFPKHTKFITQPKYALVEFSSCKLDSELKFNIKELLPETLSKIAKVAKRTTKISIKRKALPLIPVYSITTHKSQGQTLNKIIVDLVTPPGPVEVASVYVPLSRVKRLDDLLIDSSTSINIDNLVRVFKQNDNGNQNQTSVKPEHHDQWINNSIFFRQITQDISMLPTISTIAKENPSESNPNINKDSEISTDDKGAHEIKLYTTDQFRSRINRLYPFYLDFFSDRISSLDFEQHRMGLYLFYDINNGCLINDLEKESQKKTDRGKNMKRMNGLLLNEHRLFNQYAKEYATKHLTRDYEAIKSSINQFMQTWLQRKTDLLLKEKNLFGQYYSQRMAIPLNSYDSLTPVTFVNLSTMLRVGTIPLLTIPEKIEQINIKCSDNRDRIVTNRFNPNYRLTNLVDDPNLLAILSQHPSIDIVLSKSSFHLLIESFSTSPSLSPMTLPMLIREFQIETLDNPTSIQNKKKIIFIDKPLRQRMYTKRELNNKYSQRSFRSLLLSTTGGKRDLTDNQFNYSSFNNKTEFQIIEMKNKTNENSFIKQTDQEQEKRKNLTDDEDEDDEDAMIISTGEFSSTNKESCRI
ncbi:unnamed protein product, partial [Rotaria sp. Silwood2]